MFALLSEREEKISILVEKIVTFIKSCAVSKIILVQEYRMTGDLDGVTYFAIHSKDVGSIVNFYKLKNCKSLFYILMCLLTFTINSLSHIDVPSRLAHVTHYASTF